MSKASGRRSKSSIDLGIFKAVYESRCEPLNVMNTLDWVLMRRMKKSDAIYHIRSHYSIKASLAWLGWGINDPSVKC
jgi:hypothetical protein